MTGDRTPDDRLASRVWRYTNSIWLLLSILGLGFLTWLGFLIHGLRAKKLSWILSGVGWLGVLIVTIYVSNQGVAHTRIDPADNGLSGLAGLLIVFFWLGGIIHSCLTNRNWLFWKAHHGAKNLEIFEPAVESVVETVHEPLPISPSTAVPASSRVETKAKTPKADVAKARLERPQKPLKAAQMPRPPQVNDSARSASDIDSTTFVFQPAQKPTPAISPTEANG